jgi:hypothetical protein
MYTSRAYAVSETSLKLSYSCHTVALGSRFLETGRYWVEFKFVIAEGL